MPNIHSSPDNKPKILEYLKQLAPYSVVDRGIGLASAGHVLECSKSGNKITAVLHDPRNEEEYSVTLEIISKKRVSATCRCSTPEQMKEQWCQHAAATLWRACDLGFFDPYSGFADSEAIYRMNTTTPEEIATVMRDVSVETALPLSESHPPTPEVTVMLIHTSDRLGVRILFDGEIQEPNLFEPSKPPSSRALDNILLQILDEEGSWDESNQIWYINSSSQISIVLGLIQEYDQIVSASTEQQVTFSEAALQARLHISWLDTGARLYLQWILPDGSAVDKEGDLFGTGPYWTVIKSTLYPISKNAARLASIFPYAATLTLSRSQVGPLLEVLQDLKREQSSQESTRHFVLVENPELQPTSEIADPVPVLELQRRDTDSAHFTSKSEVTLTTKLEFDYPTPPEDRNHVYLPNREKERETAQLLRSFGFEYTPEKKRYSIVGDKALDFIFESADSLPESWQVEGLQEIRTNLRFSEMQFNVSLRGSNEPSAEKTGGSGIKWFDCHVSLTQNNANIPISTLFRNARTQSDRWIRLDSGAFAKVPGGGLSQLKTTLGMLDPNFRLSNTIKAKLNVAQAMGFTTLDDDQFQIASDRKLKTLSRKLADFHTLEPVKPGKNFVGELRGYQSEGLSWLTFLHQFELGGILADEMGLGKTVQALALLQHLKSSRSADKKLSGPSLIVAPTSVITNWLYETKRFTPKLSVLLLHGPGRRELFADIPKHDIVITSYALLRLDRAELEKHKYEYVILDEAQNIKNPEAATTRAAKAIKARRRLALTGTPTENRPLELWSIFDFLLQGYLGSHDFFRAHIERPIVDAAENGEAVTRYLQQKTRPFILRRLKRDVERDLPEKTESELHVQMTQSQVELYSQILDEVRPKVFDAIQKRGVRGASVSILAALLRLRQVCNHPNSIDSLKELDGFDSGKFNLFCELLEEALSSGRKILVFSQFREMLAIMRRHINSKGIEHLYLDGATRNRQELIDRFNEDESVRLFLISLKAGGTGLNLTAADTVIIYDPWWNPAVESQAVDRAHRIGQTKAVTVYRLVTENSIEQKIMELKTKKERIVDALINENNLSPLKLTKTELQNLFTLDFSTDK